MKYARTVALIAGVLCITTAVFIQGVLPALLPQSQRKSVTRVVRTDLGELKWVMADATDYTPLQAEGRRIYIREGCWYCHSQYVRPVAGEERRWGPVSQAGEYAFDQPHLFSTRRIGPDLTRVGLKFADDWHLAHHWDPRMITPDSIMPRFPWLFDGPYGPVKVVEDDQGRKSLERNATTEKLFDFTSQDEIDLTPNPDGLVFVHERGKYPVILTPNDEFTGDSVTLIGSTEELRALVAYIQKLGMNRGKWRDVFEPQLLPASNIEIPRSEGFISYGQEVYQRRCIGCHGPKGDGNGVAATFFAVRPRNFTAGAFKFRSTPSGSLPTDGDLLRTITDGVRGTPMPTWHNLPDKDRLAVIEYIEFKLAVDNSDPENPYAYFVEEPPDQTISIGIPPKPTPELLSRGKTLWQEVKCSQCHGDDGKGNGPSAGQLTDDWGFPIRPANLTTGLFKSGPSVKDIFRTISTGLNGTPMPSFSAVLPDEGDRWALAYYILSFSAYKDPLTGEPLGLSPEIEQDLDNPTVKADTSDSAFLLQAGEMPRHVWAENHGIQLLPVVEPAHQAPASKVPEDREQ